MNWTAINHGTLDDFKFPSVLYKYRDWKTNYHDRFIKNREIFLASPDSFEDIKDCKNPVRYDLLSESQIIEWYEHISKREYPKLNLQQRRKNAKEWLSRNLFKDKVFLENYRKKYNTEIGVRQGILSLTAQPNLQKMWDKYASSDTGFCVGYNTRILFEFLGGGGKVNYCTELPKILPKPFMTELEIRHKRIYTKEVKWEFEEEYRTERFWENPIGNSDRQIRLPKEAYKEVILGHKISQQVKHEIVFSIKQAIGDIPIIERKNVC